jgi:NAD(P)-dependent dehydrogenase (short-subunit alcohol dehydrogenase family)
MTHLLEDKVAFVSGAGRGIGAAAARLFAREGAQVLLTARTEDQLKTVVDEIRADGGTAEYVVSDLADPESVQAAVDRAVAVFGRLDVAFNNGATITPPGPVDRVALSDLDKIYEVNLRAPGSRWLLKREPAPGPS